MVRPRLFRVGDDFDRVESLQLREDPGGSRNGDSPFLQAAGRPANLAEPSFVKSPEGIYTLMVVETVEFIPGAEAIRDRSSTGG